MATSFELLLCAASVFSVSRWWFSANTTTETQRTQRLHREISQTRALPCAVVRWHLVFHRYNGPFARIAPNW